MSAQYSWKIAEQSDFADLYGLLYRSELKKSWNVEDVRKRIIIPLYLGLLIAFYDVKNVLRGFLTCAFMDKKSASHQETIGILPEDWMSGKDFWTVDFVANDGGGKEMLTTVMRDLDGSVIKKVNYFRFKYKQLRSVNP